MTSTRPPNDSLGLPDPEPPNEHGAELIPSAQDAYALHEAEEKEFDRVYLSLHRELGTYARFKCETREDAEDVMQTVWLKAHQQKVIALCRGNLERTAAYLREMVRNQAVDHAVHERSLLERAINFGRSLRTRAREPEQPYQHALACDIDAKLAKAMRKLPPRCADVLFLVRYCNKSYQQVAEELGISVTTVGPHLRTAKARLKNDLADYYSLPDGEGKERAR